MTTKIKLWICENCSELIAHKTQLKRCEKCGAVGKWKYGGYVEMKVK